MAKAQTIVRKEQDIFCCMHCQSSDLRQPWAGLTNEGRVYLLFVCEGCKEITPIEIDRILAPLYETQILLSPGSNLVN